MRCDEVWLSYRVNYRPGVFETSNVMRYKIISGLRLADIRSGIDCTVYLKLQSVFRYLKQQPVCKGFLPVLSTLTHTVFIGVWISLTGIYNAYDILVLVYFKWLRIHEYICTYPVRYLYLFYTCTVQL